MADGWVTRCVAGFGSARSRGDALAVRRTLASTATRSLEPSQDTFPDRASGITPNPDFRRLPSLQDLNHQSRAAIRDSIASRCGMPSNDRKSSNQFKSIAHASGDDNRQNAVGVRELRSLRAAGH
jgi:hypothetical protein